MVNLANALASFVKDISGAQDPGDYYFRVNDSTIGDAMTEILRQLVDMRLTT